MRTISGSKTRRYVAIVGIFLIMAALITGIPSSYGVGSDDTHTSENLEIRTWYDLDAIRDNLDGNHILMNDLDSTSPGYEELASLTANQGKGWDPIGFVTNFTPNGPDDSTPTPSIGCGQPVLADVEPPWHGLTGSFDGQGYEIRDLFINRPEDSYIGLFLLNMGFIKDVGVVNITVIGGDCVGGLAGQNGGIVSNSYSTGNVTGTWMVGGLTGLNGGTLGNSYSTGNVTGNSDVGGLVGWNYWGTVSDSYCTSDVSGYSSVGGLVGFNYYATVSNSYSSGSVTGNKDVGGLVGENMGLNYFSDVLNSYSTSDVTGDVHVGGLLGYNHYGTVSNSYSTGNVSGNEDFGGLVGLNDESTVTDSFWDTETSGQATSAGGTGKTTSEMQDIATFSGAGWDIIGVANFGTHDPSHIWNIVDDETYPFLSWQS